MRPLLVALLLLGGIGSAQASDMVRKVAADPIEAHAEQATVVFIRPKNGAFAIKPAILDHTGKVLGEVWTHSVLVTQMPPGEYAFIGWGEGTPRLRASLEAGEIYYVRVKLTAGAWTARPTLLAMGPGRDRWEDLPGWLRKCRRLAVDRDGMKRFEFERGADVDTVLRKSRDAWAGYDDDKRAERTLTADDGVTQDVGSR